MQSDSEKWISDTMENYRIHTNSIEQTLSPLVVQIINLVNVRERPIRSEKTARALVQVGRAVNLAVEQFVNVGEMMAEENVNLAPEVRKEMCEVCRQARLAGVAIEQQTQVRKDHQMQDGVVWIVGEKGSLVRAARQLLSAITKVLLLADKVIVRQLLNAKEKVIQNIGLLERLCHFGEFMKEFSDFGGHMVELGRLSGDRQTDLKSEKVSCQMAYLRSCLEKTTMMLLTSSKTNLRHPDCASSQKLRTGVTVHMRWLLEQLERLVISSLPSTVGIGGFLDESRDQSESSLLPPAWRCLRDIEDLLSLIRVRLNNLVSRSPSPSQSLGDLSAPEFALRSSLEALLEGAILDFIDSAFTPHSAREEILGLADRIKIESAALLHALTSISGLGLAMDERGRIPSPTPPPTAVALVLKLSELCRYLQERLQVTCAHLADEVLPLREDHTLLLGLKLAASSGDAQQTEEFAAKFSEHSERLEDVCKLLRHCANSEALTAVAEKMVLYTASLSSLVLHSARTLVAIPSSKIGKDTDEVFHEAWLGLMMDVSSLRQDIVDSGRLHPAHVPGDGSQSRASYMSLPRPGDVSIDDIVKHGISARPLHTPQMGPEDQARIARIGLEMKLITSEMEAEAERWQEPNNDIVKRAKIMSNLAFSIYLFTRGEGPLKTTHDLFTQAEYFASEGAKLHRTVAEFTANIPTCPARSDLAAQLDQLIPRCQNLHAYLRQVAIGRPATFTKVDQVIQAVKDTMSLVTKLVTACFICNTKFNMNYRQKSVQSPVPFSHLMRQHSQEEPERPLIRSRSLGKTNSSYRRLHSTSPSTLN